MLERCRVVCFVSAWEGGGEGGRGVKAVFWGAVSLFEALASRHARRNCRRFLAVQFFWSKDVSRCAFVSRVPCASMGLGLKIVFSIDEKVAQQSRYRT